MDRNEQCASEIGHVGPGLGSGDSPVVLPSDLHISYFCLFTCFGSPYTGIVGHLFLTVCFWVLYPHSLAGTFIKTCP